MIILYTILFFSGAIRLLRWLSIVQQKEYRWDRIRIFLTSIEGLRELVRIIPRISDFSRTGLKRPKLTGRVAVVAGLSVVILGLLIFLTERWLEQVSDQISGGSMLRIFFLLSCYICLPMIVLIASIPTAIISYLQTSSVLILAKRKINRNKPLIIGITGSYGKTATKQLLAHLLKSEQSVFVTPKSFNTRYSVAQSIEKKYQSEQVAILEYGAYSKGEIARLAQWFQPSIAIITGFAPQHLGLFGSRQAIIDAKSELIAALPLDGVVVYNAMDEGTQSIVKVGVKKWQIRHKNKKGPTIIACDPTSSKQNNNYSLSSDGYLQIQSGKQLIQTQMAGLQYAQTLEMAMTVTQYLNVPASSLSKSLIDFEPSANFMRIVKSKSGITIIDDSGTSNPVGFKAAINLLNHCNAERKFLITAGIVDLGNESAAIHKVLAINSKSVVEKVLFTGWSGRAEFQAVFGENCIVDQAVIIKAVVSLQSKDAVLVEGRVPGWLDQAIKQL